MTTTAFSMRIPEELKTSLKEMSALSHRSQSQIAIKAIAEYVNRNEWKMKAIQEAKKQADKGEFISHAATETWLDS
ncbi:CopG family transcriptional regulator [Methylococcaceae bacterium HT5]|nr:CopG family transcriptional regulator [Methylococcaceae bacterium HT5]